MRVWTSLDYVQGSCHAPSTTPLALLTTLSHWLWEENVSRSTFRKLRLDGEPSPDHSQAAGTV